MVPIYALAGDGSVIPEDFQPRYLLPVIAVLPAMVILGRDASDEGPLLSRSQLVVITGAVVVAQLAALHTNMRRYVWGAERLGFNLDSNRSWWWPGAPARCSCGLSGRLPSPPSSSCCCSPSTVASCAERTAGDHRPSP